MERSIHIASKIESLRIIEKLIDEMASLCKLNNIIYGNILVAALEGTNNAIVHGNKLDEKKVVYFSMTCDEKEVHLVIKDQGMGFDYMHVPDPTAPENIENISGRGVFLMQKLSDNVVFMENGSKVELIFKLR